MPTFGHHLTTAALAAVVVVACGCPAGAGPSSTSASALLPMTVLPNKHAFVAATIGGVTGTVRIELDSRVSYLLNSARERMSLPLKDGMTPLPSFQLDGAMTNETLVTLAPPEDQEIWLAERPDLLAVLGRDVLGAQPVLIDPVRQRFGWGTQVRGREDLVVPMRAKKDHVPVIEATLDGRPVRLKVDPWAAGLMVHGESVIGQALLGKKPFQAQVRWGRYNWAMPAGQHVLAVSDKPMGRPIVNVLAPYVADSEEDKQLIFIAEGWQGQLALAALSGWQVVIDYPERKVRFQPLR
jgi:hypothetical protein